MRISALFAVWKINRKIFDDPKELIEIARKEIVNSDAILLDITDKAAHAYMTGFFRNTAQEFAADCDLYVPASVECKIAQ